MHKQTVSLFFAGAFLFFSCSTKKAPTAPKKDAPTIVDVIVAQARTITHTVEANGTIVAGEYVELHPEISGRITFLNVPEGKMIAKGTVIAKIYDGDLQAQLAKSRILLDTYEKTEARLHTLLTAGGLNQADYDVALNNVNSTRADIQYTQAQIDRTVIRAPFSGLVGLRQVSPGGYVTSANIIATVQEVSQLKIDFTIPEEYSSIIQKGNTVDVETDAVTKTKRKAVIIATEPQINQATRNLKVRALIDNPGGLNPGGFVKIMVSSGSDTKAILVPSNAIIPDDKNNQLILVKGGKANFVNVEKGVRQANNVEITKGVNVGDTVVITGVLFARPKGILKVRSVKTIEQVSKDDPDVAQQNSNSY